VSFDIDPNDKYERFLLFHPESDSLFVVTSRAEMYNIMDGEPLVENVTGHLELEERFKREQIEKG
jgi:hypothetical protein